MHNPSMLTPELWARFENTLNAVYGDRVPRDSDDLTPLDPLMVDAICDGDDPYRNNARKWVIV